MEPLILVPLFAVVALVAWLVWQILRGAGFVLSRLFSGIGALVRRLAAFVKYEVVECVQLGGAVLTATVLLPLTVVNFLIGRWDTGRHYFRAIEDEAMSAGLGLYRIALGHPLRFAGLGGLLDGLERRIPDVVDRAPRRPTKKNALEFDGYELIGTLPVGGSGAQLYLARPYPETFERFQRQGKDLSAQVVIKSFALVQGSTIPQIVRESRALEAANRLGLVYEHHLEEDRFYYVMEHIQGDDLDHVVQRMHARSSPEGLGREDLKQLLSYAEDLLRTLDRFHTGGLWHKDVKPANIIVSAKGAKLVDFGLVTPLQSALTLTTHGTEYYRDPEMVRLAMQGVKVHEVDGVKFDLYSTGAVLFSMVENSFPAHGSLSQLSKRCPEALVWVIRRAMAEIGSRYGSAWEMLEDVAAIAQARDPYALRLADLPSVIRGNGGQPPLFERFDGRRAAEFASEPVAAASASGERERAKGRRPYLLADQHVPAPRYVRRSRRRRVVAASLMIGMFFISIARMIESRSHSRAVPVYTTARNGASLRLSPSERKAYEAGQTVLDAVSVDDEPTAERTLEQDLAAYLERGRSSSTSEPAANPNVAYHPPSRTVVASTRADSDGGVATPRLELPKGSRVMILDDEREGVARATLAQIEDKLTEDGLEVVETSATELYAGARHALGVSSLDDEEARERLQEFLDGEENVDVIVWVAKDDVRVLRRR